MSDQSQKCVRTSVSQGAQAFLGSADQEETIFIPALRGLASILSFQALDAKTWMFKVSMVLGGQLCWRQRLLGGFALV